MTARLLLLLLPLTACSSSSPVAIDAKGVDPKPIDAALIDAAPGVDARPIDAPPIDAPPIDAPPTAPTVVTVTCPASGVPVVMTTDAERVYTPATTSTTVNGIVKFAMSSYHNVIPDTALPTDDGLRVNFGATMCLRFTKAGTFNFYCQPHGFKGSITVQ